MAVKYIQGHELIPEPELRMSRVFSWEYFSFITLDSTMAYRCTSAST